MRTNYVPAIIMLLAGLIDSVISIYYKLDLLTYTKRLLLVLVIFYILGIVVKIVLDKYLVLMDDSQTEQTSEENHDEDNPMENIDTETGKNAETTEE